MILNDLDNMKKRDVWTTINVDNLPPYKRPI